MRRLTIVLMMGTALVAGACGASGSGDEPAEGSSTTEGGGDPTEAAAEGTFGDLDATLCGAGDFSVDPAEAGSSAGTLAIGVPNDRSSQIRPGLNKVMYDASVAFADWCNEQGGIGGLQIEVVDLDAALFNVEAAMSKACGTVFALVGGGLAQDALEFSGKDGSDFHKCGLIDIPGYAVSVEKADSNGQVQPVPNPGSSASNTWFRDLKELQPDALQKWGVLWGELPSLEIVKAKNEAVARDVGGIEVVPEQTYPPTGAMDWTPYSRKLIGTGATSFSWVGEASNLASFLTNLRQQGWEGTPLLEANMYDPELTAAGEAAEGTVLRMAFHPLEEADRWPAVQQYIDMVEQRVDGGKIGQLGMQSTSAWLLFTVAANACGEKNDGVLTRTCILEEAAAVEDWTGGGLHAPQDPARHDEAKASPCSMLLVVKGGEFERLYPKIDGDGDDGDGFHCPADGVTTITADVGEGKVDPSRPI
ncbi:ABC transporter substrate-binding protein [Dermatobacter hominis]|uniref:ABC transporter substrate-binding protein n=1 Tax=Dermatobacter hominis TaxID=2884263 RepID=UPI001D10FC2C|nr:ABC transporter substrate-binding protein [Dermatobacter hominis]UDY34957.1 ABC transporter substrate-binding protein [Dermatobacter hominis]